MRFCLVAPAYNERGKIGAVVRKVSAVAASLPCPCTMVVVDDGSTDDTADEARDAGAVVLQQPRNQGVGAAIRRGIDYAREGFEFVGVISGDDQHEPTELGRLLEPLVADRADFVQGSRYLPGGRVVNAPMSRSLLTRLYPVLFRVILGYHCSDATNGLRAFKTSIFADQGIDLWQPWLDTYELEPYLLYQALRRVRVVEVPCTVRYHSREVGYTKMRSWRDIWRIGRPMILLRLGLKR